MKHHAAAGFGRARSPQRSQACGAREGFGRGDGRSRAMAEAGRWPKQGDGRSRAMADAGRWPKQGDGRSRAMAEAGRWLGLSFMCRCSQSPAVTPDSSTAKMYRSSSPGACRVRACGRAERALCRASTVACGVRTSMWPVVAVMHADNGAGPSVDVPCGLSA
jgi:hypothetical protein